MSKYGYLRAALDARGLLQPGGFVSPAPAGARLLELAHTPAYVEKVLNLALTDEDVRQIGLPCTVAVVRRSRLSVAGTHLAAWLALEHGIACNLAGGSHHASTGHGAGFCVFNDVAVAARATLAQGLSPPLLIIDADVHQGDGTAHIFAEDPRVFTFSIHAARNYPAQKARSDLDVPLSDGTPDGAYLEALRHSLGAVLDQVSPKLVFYNAGVDVHAEDKLGRLSLSNDGIRARDAMVIETVRAADIPLVGVLGGGYSDVPEHLAARHAILFEEAARVQALTA